MIRRKRKGFGFIMSVRMEKNIGQKLVLILILMKVVELILERAQDNVPKSLEQEKLGLIMTLI
ncbi:hypothetical protein JY19_08010 [Neisseria meningitidis]|nr:hypothetical protein JY19_08010 [Neisseria meningitidis]RPC68979.1 hypothetical protein JY60_04320 [Neisseria meningitidis]